MAFYLFRKGQNLKSVILDDNQRISSGSKSEFGTILDQGNLNSYNSVLLNAHVALKLSNIQDAFSSNERLESYLARH